MALLARRIAVSGTPKLHARAHELTLNTIAIDGADYSGTYGISTSGNALTLKFVTKGSYSTNIGSRTYLMDGDSKYQMFNVVGKEFTFDVDVSKLPCGLNGALYFVEMAADGDMGKGNNKAGAKYGTGKPNYCSTLRLGVTNFSKDTATPSVPAISSGSRVLPIPKDGSHPPRIRMLELASTDPAAVKWTSGRPTQSPLPIPLTLARRSAFRSAPVMLAVAAPTATEALAILMVAISTYAFFSTFVNFPCSSHTNTYNPELPPR